MRLISAALAYEGARVMQGGISWRGTTLLIFSADRSLSFSVPVVCLQGSLLRCRMRSLGLETTTAEATMVVVVAAAVVAALVEHLMP